MKMIPSLLALVAAFGLALGTSRAISFPDETESTTAEETSSQKYLVVTEHDNGKTIQLPTDTLLCVRLYNSTTCTYHEKPTDPFLEMISTWSFKGASSTEFLQLQKNLSAVPANATSSSLGQKTEREYVFAPITTGETTLTFNKFFNPVGHNGSPIPHYVRMHSIFFTIETIAP